MKSMKYIYFVKPVAFTGPIKIGVTRDVGRRLDDLMKWSPIELHLIASVPGDGRTEARIHRMLADTHRHKEWFDPSPRLFRLIDRVLDGSFREDLLPQDARPLWFERHARILKYRKIIAATEGNVTADDLLEAAAAKRTQVAA